jgi:hypothetical protein
VVVIQFFHQLHQLAEDLVTDLEAHQMVQVHEEQFKTQVLLHQLVETVAVAAVAAAAAVAPEQMAQMHLEQLPVAAAQEFQILLAVPVPLMELAVTAQMEVQMLMELPEHPIPERAAELVVVPQAHLVAEKTAVLEL